jgi:hypothetical protein
MADRAFIYEAIMGWKNLKDHYKIDAIGCPEG